MSYLINKPEFAGQIYEKLQEQAKVPNELTDGMNVLMLLSGILIETLLLFDDPEEGLYCSIEQLSSELNSEPYQGPLSDKALPPSYMVDFETEKGRELARYFFEEWLNCAHEFHDLILFIINNFIVRLEREGMARCETLRLFHEISKLCLAYEFAAQELCDIVIDSKISKESWSLGECISGLSAISGRRLALSDYSHHSFCVPDLPGLLDNVSYVMTQEAVRLGLPAGSDWRFGLAANDIPSQAPYELICHLEPELWELFHVLELHDPIDQSVSCAKAAGRMLALASGGDTPEIEAVISKPLAMYAMTQTYKAVSIELLSA